MIFAMLNDQVGYIPAERSLAASTASAAEVRAVHVQSQEERRESVGLFLSKAQWTTGVQQLIWHFQVESRPKGYGKGICPQHITWPYMVQFWGRVTDISRISKSFLIVFFSGRRSLYTVCLLRSHMTHWYASICGNHPARCIYIPFLRPTERILDKYVYI